MSDSEATGLLFSQVGYDTGLPIRAVVRGPAGTLPDSAPFVVRAAGGAEALTGELHRWGTLWGADWWVADLSGLAAGEYELTVGGFAPAPLTVAPRLLWERTWRLVGPEQGERRQPLAMNKVGWQDCGAAWQEANSHAAFILGLLDVLELRAADLTDDDRARVEAQVVTGCDYLALLQDRAGQIGHPPGSLAHQTPRLEEVVLPRDAILAAVSWARGAQLLSDPAKRDDYRVRAGRAVAWRGAGKEKFPPEGFSHVLNGAPAGCAPPADQWETRDLLLLAWAAFELWRAHGGLRQDYRDHAAAFANAAGRRQVPESAPEGEFYGHFYAFDGTPAFTEKAWSHQIDTKTPGGDAGGHFPHWVLPLLFMARAWPDHPDAARWRQAVRAFAYGYLLPACRANPFYLLPLGYFAGEGLLWFAGSWHGMNAIYPLAAALALECAQEFGDQDAFREVAAGNLQWVAGLNAGLTRAAMEKGCVVFRTDLPEGEAVPVSMIHGVGRRYAGTWYNARGSICNGFATGAQFRFDVPATRDNDAPSSFTDEDWISHGGAWLSAIARLP